MPIKHLTSIMLFMMGCLRIMAAAILLREKANPTDVDIDDAMTGNICRCGTYLRIRKAIHVAAELRRTGVK